MGTLLVDRCLTLRKAPLRLLVHNHECVLPGGHNPATEVQ